MRSLSLRAIGLAFVALLATHVAAQNSLTCDDADCTQTFTLEAGWNAIWLEVDPVNDDPDAVFAGLPLDSVWMWNPRFSPVDYIADPDEEKLANRGFLGYFPPTRPENILSRLFAVRGGQAFLLRLTQPATLTAQGLAVARPIRWSSDSFNLVGAPVDSGQLTIPEFFSASAAHDGQLAYRLRSDGTWIEDVGISGLERGEAFWIFTDGGSDYQGPLDLGLPRSGVVDFGRAVPSRAIEIGLLDEPARTVEVRALGDGVAALAFRQRDRNDATRSWIDLPTSLTVPTDLTGSDEEPPPPAPFVAIEPGGSFDLDLGLRRAGMSSALAGHLEFRDGQGVRRFVPVRGDTPVADRAGLWVGIVALNRVSHIEGTPGRACSGADPMQPPQPCAVDGDCTEPQTCSEFLPPPEPTCVCGPADEDGFCPLCAAAFTFPVLMHVSATDVLLLEEVYQVCEPLADEPRACAEDVLLTDPDAAANGNYLGVINRGDVLVPQRWSTAAFDLPDLPGLPSGSISLGSATDFGIPTKSQIGMLSIAADAATHPYRHAYHPDHDGVLPAGCAIDSPPCSGPQCQCFAETWDISRNINIKWGSDDSSRTLDSNERVIGTWRETVGGMRSVSRDGTSVPIVMQGTIELSRVSRAATITRAVPINGGTP